MRKDEYIKECMVGKSRKKVLWEKLHFSKYPVYFFLMFNISRKSIKHLLEMVQVTVSKILFWCNLKNEGEGPFYMNIIQNMHVKCM